MKRDAHILRVAVVNLHKEVKKEGDIQDFDSEDGTPTVDEIMSLNDCELPHRIA